MDDELQPEKKPSKTEEAEPQINIIGDRNALIYSLNEKPRQVEELSDSFYELTTTDLKFILRDLRRVANGDDDAPIMTREQRELERNKIILNKMARYKNCIIRIQFPDRYVLQGVFLPSDTVQHVADFVRGFLLSPERQFSLFTTPPRTILTMQKNLIELELVPTAVVHFMWNDELSNTEEAISVLKPEYLKKLTSMDGAVLAAKNFRLLQRSKSSETKYIDDGELPSTSRK